MEADPIRLSVLPELRWIAAGERRATFVARIEPPPVPAERPGVRVVLGLDTSASMGYGRLDRALECASAVVQALGTRDTFACVGFDRHATVLVPPLAMTGAGKDVALSALRAARADSGTNLGAGLERALEIAGVLRAGAVVLLLTDGCPTEGITDPAALVELAQKAKGVTVSTFGFGRDVDPTLLLALAEAAHGGYTFIEGDEPPMEAVGAELGAVLRTAAIDVTLTLIPEPLSRVTRVDCGGRLTLEPALGSVRLDLNPLVAGEPAHVAFELTWEGDAELLATLELSARLAETGKLATCAAPVTATFRPGRGAPDSAAGKEILLARAAAALRGTSAGEPRSPGQIAGEIEAQRQALEQSIVRLGLSADPQMGAALGMLGSVRDGLSAAQERAVRAAHQDLVAVAIAIGQRRSSMFQPAAGQDAFVTPSQRVGRAILDELWRRRSGTPGGGS